MSGHNYLILPHLKVFDANAFTGKLTFGFPALTSFGGAVDKVMRHINEKLPQLRAEGFGVICHDFELKMHRKFSNQEFQPVYKKKPMVLAGQKIKQPSFIPEISCDLEVTLLIMVEGLKNNEADLMLSLADGSVNSNLKIAKGRIKKAEKAIFIQLADTDKEKIEELLKEKIKAGYALVSRQALVKREMEQGKDALEILCDYLCESVTEINNDTDKQLRLVAHKAEGNLVPVCTGYRAISSSQVVRNQRDPDCSHVFAENIITLGEFVSSSTINNLENLLWYRVSDDLNNMAFIQKQENSIAESNLTETVNYDIN